MLITDVKLCNVTANQETNKTMNAIQHRIADQLLEACKDDDKNKSKSELDDGIQRYSAFMHAVNAGRPHRTDPNCELAWEPPYDDARYHLIPNNPNSNNTATVLRGFSREHRGLGSANAIGVLLHCYLSHEPHPHADSEAVGKTLSFLASCGAIHLTPKAQKFNCYETTPMGKAWVQALCDVPAPRSVFVNEAGNPLDNHFG